MKVIIVIPARYSSSRFPGKPLVNLVDKPMIQWVAELSEKVVGKENVFIATENQKIFDLTLNLGYQAIMTSKNALTGTDRIAEVAENIDADIYINIQGDEPLVNPEDIEKIIEAKKKYYNEVICGYSIIGENEDEKNINIPKVIFTEDEKMIYMSRNPLPGFKSQLDCPKIYYKQVCIYAFNKEELIKYKNFNRKSIIESSEDIEIIRFLEWGQVIRMVKTLEGSLAVDVPSDISKVEFALRKLHGNH